MQELGLFSLHQMTDTICKMHKWKVYVEIANLEQWIQLDLQSTSIDRVSWELEKDWSAFISGDVSFSIEDLDASISDLIGNNTQRVKIYANYSDYSHNEDILCFCGYIVPSQTKIENGIVTYYAQSILTWLEQFPYYGRYTLTDYFTPLILPFRVVLQNDYDLISAARLNFEHVDLWAFDRTVNNFYLTQALINNQKMAYDKDLVYETEDSDKYTCVAVNNDGNVLYLRRVDIYRGDLSKVIENNHFLMIALTHQIDSVRIFNSSSTAYKYIILVKQSDGPSEFLREIIKIKNDWTYEIYTFSLTNSKAVFNSANLSDDGAFIVFIGQDRYGVTKHSYFRLFETASMTITQTIDLGSDYYNCMVYSGDVTVSGSDWYYGFINKRGVTRYLSVFKFSDWTRIEDYNIGISAFDDKDVIKGTGSYFFIDGETDYYDCVGDVHTAITGASANSRFGGEWWSGNYKSVYMTDFTNKRFRMFRDSGSALIEEFACDIENLTSVPTWDIGDHFYKFRLLRESNKPEGIIGVPYNGFPIDTVRKYFYAMLSEKCPFMIDFTDYAGPTSSFSVRQALIDFFGSYFMSFHIKDWTDLETYSEINVYSQPRITQTTYIIPQDSIVFDSIKTEPYIKYKIVVESQGSNASAGAGEELSFQYNCLPVALLQDIADFINSQFEDKIKVTFQGDSLFYVELADWITIIDSQTNIQYDGIVIKNEINNDGLCDIEMFATATEL